MSNDQPGFLIGHLADAARHHHLAARPTGNAGLAWRGAFHGQFKNFFWDAWAWSPDGAVLVAAGRDTAGSQAVGRPAASRPIVAAWDARNGQEQHHGLAFSEGLSGTVRSLAWSPDGDQLAIAEVDESRGRWAVHIQAVGHGARRTLSIPDAFGVRAGCTVSHVAWSPSGELIALSGPRATGVLLVDPRTGEIRQAIREITGRVSWSPSGDLLAGLADRATVALADPATGRVVQTLGGHWRLTMSTGRKEPAPLAWSKGGAFLAVGDGASVHLWDVTSAARLAKLGWGVPEGNRGPDGAVDQVEWLDDGRYLAEFRSRGGRMRGEQGEAMSSLTLWDVQTGPLTSELLGTVLNAHGTQHPVVYPASGFALSPDGRAIAVLGPRRPPQTWTITG
jgi:WD40 repeat protein